MNIQKECAKFDELVSKHHTKDFLVKISNPKFRLLLHIILHLNRIPTDQEWDFIKRLSKVQAGSQLDCARWFEHIKMEDSNISFRFISGVGLDVTKLCYPHDKSGIPLVSSAVIDLVSQKLPEALLIFFTPEISVLGTIAETNLDTNKKGGVRSSSRFKNRKFRNILLHGLYASAREIKVSMPTLYSLLLKVIRKTRFKLKISGSKREDFIIDLPLDLTLISVYPILDKQSFYRLKLFEECSLLRIIPIIHDILPITFPQYFPDNAFEDSYDYVKLMANQENVFFVSSHVRDEFQRVFPNNSVINKYLFNLPDLLARNIIERATHIDSITKFEQKPYILTISTIEPRKNHLNLLLALRDIFVQNKHLKLILLGGYGWKNQFIMTIISSGVFSSRVEVRRNIPENEKIALIKGALFTVYPSMHEGFGLPIMESLLLSKRVLFHNQKPMLDFKGLPGAIAIDMGNIDLLQKSILLEISSQEILDNSKEMQYWIDNQNNKDFLELLARLKS